ncbi:MAG: hypothetical protein IPL53_21430 [Ignavibacteria bacterium]|nr:hypothetical protein [Ignavibacteria bacterium]
MNNLNSDKKVPSVYSEYPWYAIVDLNKASMTKYVMNEEDYYVKQNKAKGNFYLELDIGNELVAQTKTWDGYSIKKSVNRTRNIDTKYPIWLMEAFCYGVLDCWIGKRRRYLCLVSIMKETGTIDALFFLEMKRLKPH